MKIAVCAIGNTPASHVAPFSGRTAGFVIYDSDSFRFTYLDPSTEEKQVKKRCCPVADMFVDAGIEVIVVSGIAFETARLLGRAGIKIYECISATVWESIQALKLNLLESIDSNPDGPDYREMAVEK
jgi:predicted Fe-Mo cluster-binding NifX family protein